jgi:hypothetical protein
VIIQVTNDYRKRARLKQSMRSKWTTGAQCSFEQESIRRKLTPRPILGGNTMVVIPSAMISHQMKMTGETIRNI